MSALSERPANPVVGQELPHESAALHVTGTALYTDDLVGRTKDCLHAYPLQAPYAHARVTRLRTEPALDVPGVVRVLTADDVPGVNDAGVKHDEPLSPGCVPCTGCDSCIWSPTSTMLRAESPIPTRFARGTWPASSTNR